MLTIIIAPSGTSSDIVDCTYADKMPQDAAILHIMSHGPVDTVASLYANTEYAVEEIKVGVSVLGTWEDDDSRFNLTLDFLRIPALYSSAQHEYLTHVPKVVEDSVLALAHDVINPNKNNMPDLETGVGYHLELPTIMVYHL